MGTPPPYGTTETFGDPDSLVEFTSPMFPPETFPDRVRIGRPVPSDRPSGGRTILEAITYHIDSGPPQPPESGS